MLGNDYSENPDGERRDTIKIAFKETCVGNMNWIEYGKGRALSWTSLATVTDLSPFDVYYQRITSIPLPYLKKILVWLSQGRENNTIKSLIMYVPH
jgi:hypothetical protein